LRQSQGHGAELPFLLGVEQGAIMALATAAAVPDLLSGVIAIAGALSSLSGLGSAARSAHSLPVLLLDMPTSIRSVRARIRKRARCSWVPWAYVISERSDHQ
jgi:predicted esterase